MIAYVKSRQSLNELLSWSPFSFDQIFDKSSTLFSEKSHWAFLKTELIEQMSWNSIIFCSNSWQKLRHIYQKSSCNFKRKAHWVFQYPFNWILLQSSFSKWLETQYSFVSVDDKTSYTFVRKVNLVFQWVFNWTVMKLSLNKCLEAQSLLFKFMTKSSCNFIKNDNQVLSWLFNSIIVKSSLGKGLEAQFLWFKFMTKTHVTWSDMWINFSNNCSIK